ncbi:MAG TPA: D-2-hydroxyacid dehydrogenase [Gemmatimonadaceae bacterium]|nr:D-2-hydroxyacid dehydrogenase [Gemmatimonadaceae bacterium]
MNPRRVIIGAPQFDEIARGIRAARPDLEIRGARVESVTDDDLDWADTYTGFRRPNLPTMGNVRWVHCTGAGVDAWLYPVELPRDILLTRTSESFGPMIAEWALARALAFAQQLVAVSDDQRRHAWVHRDIPRLGGTTAVVLGTGDVGTHVARAFAALGCIVHGISRSGRGDASVFATTSTIDALERLAAAADWLIVTLPLTAETNGLVSRRVLAACRGAVLLNAGRGAVVAEAAVVGALDDGWLRGAALDVFETEPLPAASPLWSHPRVMISPHISGITTTDGAVRGFVECLSEIEHGTTPARAVNRDRQY